jgi:hypothetical protein
MHFQILGDIRDPETIARGRGVRDRKRLGKMYGRGLWRKRKGFATVRLRSGEIRDAELHWYEAGGIGKREFKIKRFVDHGGPT